MAVPQRKHYFTVKEYHAMAEAGIFTEADRVELIEGEIFEMSPIGNRHASHVNRLTNLFIVRLNQQVIVSVQNPVEVNDFSEPQPDLSLLKWRDDFYINKHPTPKDLLLVIEVADSTVSFDRNFKMPMYARSKIPQAMLVNLPEDVIEFYSKPIKGKYTKVEYLKRGDSLSLLSFPEIIFTVKEILG